MLPAIFGRQASTCLQGSEARQDIPQVSVEIMHVTGKKFHHVRLNADFRSDITVKGPAIEAFTDASGGMGCGEWWSPHWMQLKWSQLSGPHLGSLGTFQ